MKNKKLFFHRKKVKAVFYQPNQSRISIIKFNVYVMFQYSFDNQKISDEKGMKNKYNFLSMK